MESFGVEQALKYKFKPLIVDGVAVQMEMPLVLHFTSHIEDPIPILTVEEMKRQTISCNPTPLPAGSIPAGNVLVYRMSVDEHGNLAGMGPAKWDGRMNGPPKEWVASINSLQSCKFKSYVVNGHTTYYKGDVELVAQ